MTAAEREEHLRARPEPDGFVSVELRHGSGFTFQNSEGRGWQQNVIGLVFRHEKNSETGSGRDRVVPWSNIAWYDIVHDSDEFDLRLLEWLRECDHEWVTNPNPSVTYCVHCRLDFDDLARVMSPDAKRTPDLVIESEEMDDAARAFDGRRPESAEQSQPAVTTVIIDASATDGMCGCSTIEHASHPGRCKFRPETWVAVEDDDDDGVDF